MYHRPRASLFYTPSLALNLECGGRGEARAGDTAFPLRAELPQHDAKAVSTSYARKLASDFATALQVQQPPPFSDEV